MDALLELVPFLALAVTGGVSYRLARRAKGKVLNWFWLVWLILSLAMFCGYLMATGWDALLFLLMLAGISAPMAVGGAIGGLIGVVRRENADPEESS